LKKYHGVIERTSGIVLNQIKHTDSGIVAQVFTEKFGRQSFMVKGVRNRKSGRQAALFRPLTVLDMIVYYRDVRSMQSLKEVTVEFAPAGIYGNILKSSMAIFIGEVLTAVLREEGQQAETYGYIKESIMYLDSRTDNCPNFHIAFLIGLTGFLGFEPGKQSDGDHKVFDLVNGCFMPVPPAHGIYSGTEISSVFAEFFQSSWETMNSIALTGQMRNDVLSELLRFYSVHLTSLGKIKSIDVLREVFR
jgi:DNA repair protein RecO (recombination protein O)